MYLMLGRFLWLGKYATLYKWQDNILYGSYLSALEIKVLMKVPVRYTYIMTPFDLD
jgi:hypothetical protein